MIDNATWRDARFRKSSYSGSAGGNCVEIAMADSYFGVRDSKNPVGPVLVLGPDRARAFLAAIQREQIAMP
jgi:Domain of unknown function (DUF397)